MKKNILLFLIFSISLSFNLKQNEKYVPSDLKFSNVTIIERNFIDWEKTIDGNPKGYDEIAKESMFNNYIETINNVELLFNKYGVKNKRIQYELLNRGDSLDYIFDYKLNCVGGERDHDWWMCLGGFYFMDCKINKEFDMIATDKRTVTIIEKELKKQKK